MADLIITNGDTAADLLRAAGSRATILPWQDVLHEGPVVAGPLAEQSAVRVSYLAHRFRIAEADVAASFAERDAVFARQADFARIELWFEHDLYDQLQLLQTLSLLAEAGRQDGVMLVQADDFLGAQRPDTIIRFAENARAVTADDLAVATAVWAGLASPTPEATAAHVGALSERLPFLRSALLRFLAELPAPGSGLGRTEAAILAGIASGTASPTGLFHQVILEEEAAFMGDASFYCLLDDLASCDVPLIAGLAPPAAAEDARERLEDAELELTMAGDDVLAGEADHVAMSGIDRWWGGTHLRGRDVWRYDRAAQALIPPLGQGELAL